MVEVTSLDSSSFLSISDKHRGTRFPQTIDDDVCLDAGFQCPDGSFVRGKSRCVLVTTPSWRLAHELDATADEIPVRHSTSRDPPTTGFILRINEEKGIRR